MVQEMKKTGEYDKLLTGIVSGLILPLLTGLIIYLLTAHDRSLLEYLDRIVRARILTHAITLCVFPNVLIFLLFNRLDMLRASRGVLAITIVWAISVFIIKFS
jgi:hypothetical protein